MFDAYDGPYDILVFDEVDLSEARVIDFYGLSCFRKAALVSAHSQIFTMKNYQIPYQLSHMYKQRLMKEATEAAKKNFTDYLLIFNSADLFAWEAYILGPQDTPYQNRIFHVKMLLTNEYPIAPPKIYFKTKIFHPNIHFHSGQVCLDIIKNDWSPTWTLESLCRALRVLMESPNEDSPLNCDAANLIRLKQKEAYDSLCRMYAREYAISKQDYDKKLKETQEQEKKMEQN